MPIVNGKWQSVYAGPVMDQALEDALDSYRTLEVDDKDAATLLAAQLFTTQFVNQQLPADHATITYVDQQDALVLQAAKDYADTTTGDEVTQSYVDDADTLVLFNAKAYTDVAVTNAYLYIDNEITQVIVTNNAYADLGDANALIAANDYSDVGDAATLAAANLYTDNHTPNTTPLEIRIGNTRGYGVYKDSIITQLGSQVFVSNVPQKFTVDAVAMSEEDLPDGASPYWDPALNQITLDQVNATYGFGFSATVLAGMANQNAITTWRVVDGISPGVDYVMGERCIRLSKTNSATTSISMYFAVPAGVIMMSGPIELDLTFEGTGAEVWNKSIRVIKLNAPLLP
jgi:hypothetical protein